MSAVFTSVMKSTVVKQVTGEALNLIAPIENITGSNVVINDLFAGLYQFKGVNV